MAGTSLALSASFVRRTIITALTGFLVIFWLLRDIGLRGIECITGVYAEPVNCIGNYWFELIFWAFVICLIIWDLRVTRQFSSYFESWKRLWVILPILAMVMISSIWSIAPVISMLKSLILWAASFAVLFIVFQLTREKLLTLLSVYFFILIAASYLLILAIPSLGTMQNAPYNGAWSGVFWHRNYLGSLMAFASLVFLFQIFLFSGKTYQKLVVNLVGFITAAALVVGSRSAAGILTLAILCGLFALIFIWTKIRKKLKPIHYILISASLIGIAVLVITNLNFIFGLLNRNTSLTGRIPLWNTLFENYISNRLFLGHGYGALWSFSEFRLGLQAELGWGYPVMIGDNGLIDILLHLGIIGAAIMVMVILFALYASVKFALVEKSLGSFFPLMIVVFVIVSNISLSLLIELEYFTWALLIIAILFSARNTSKPPSAST